MESYKGSEPIWSGICPDLALIGFFVFQTYFPNPHKLLTIPEQEQDFRARQMAETGKLNRCILYSFLLETRFHESLPW